MPSQRPTQTRLPRPGPLHLSGAPATAPPLHPSGPALLRLPRRPGECHENPAPAQEAGSILPRGRHLIWETSVACAQSMNGLIPEDPRVCLSRAPQAELVGRRREGRRAPRTPPSVVGDFERVT